jgi:WD40 repeat protein
MVTLVQKEEIEESFVHCLSFNFFGNRLAMCYGDGNIQVWENTGNKWAGGNKWASSHAGAIFKVRWGSPEFGSILGTCSFDKTVNIYEENPLEKTWKKIAQLVESREPVEDIQFGPVHLGLVLAACSSNGEVRLYEPSSRLNLKNWDNTHTFTASLFGSNALAWNPSSLHPMLLIGNNDPEKARAKFGKTFEAPVETLQLWEFTEESKQWEKISSPGNHDKSVIEISWALLMGRSKHIVATADTDGNIIIWRINSRNMMEIEDTITDPSKSVQSMSWDLMGTILSSTSNDNTLRLWKKTLQGKWVLFQELKE